MINLDKFEVGRSYSIKDLEEFRSQSVCAIKMRYEKDGVIMICDRETPTSENYILKTKILPPVPVKEKEKISRLKIAYSKFENLCNNLADMIPAKKIADFLKKPVIDALNTPLWGEYDAVKIRN